LRQLKIRVEEKSGRELRLSLWGEDHTVLNVLVDELNRLPGVEMAAYEQAHPLTGEYRLVIRTNGEVSPLDALRAAGDKLRSIYGRLLAQVDAQAPG